MGNEIREYLTKHKYNTASDENISTISMTGLSGIRTMWKRFTSTKCLMA